MTKYTYMRIILKDYELDKIDHFLSAHARKGWRFCSLIPSGGKDTAVLLERPVTLDEEYERRKNLLGENNVGTDGN